MEDVIANDDRLPIRQSKRRKMENKIEKSPKRTHITDLVPDCLERIFMYLKVMDLVNVADVCMYFRNCSYLPFGEKYSKKIIEIRSFPGPIEDYLL